MLRFDRTYEGLKRPHREARGPQGPRFDRTYEGLKQVRKPEVASPRPNVLTVPMRV